MHLPAKELLDSAFLVEQEQFTAGWGKGDVIAKKSEKW